MKKTQVAKSMLNPWSNIFSNWVLTWINHGVNIFKTHGCFFSYLTHEKNGVQAQAGGIVYVTGRSSPGKESAGKPREGVDKNPGKVMVSLGKWSTNGGFPHPIWNHIYISYVSYVTYMIYIYISCIYIYVYCICILYRSVCLFLFGRICFTSSEEGHLLEIFPIQWIRKIRWIRAPLKVQLHGSISEGYSSSLWVNDSHKGSKLVILPQCIPILPPLYLWYLEQPSSEFDIEKLMRQLGMATKNKAPMKPRIWLKVVVRHPTKWVKRILHLSRIIEISKMLFFSKAREVLLKTTTCC